MVAEIRSHAMPLAQKKQCDPQGKTTCAAFSAAARP